MSAAGALAAAFAAIATAFEWSRLVRDAAICTVGILAF
jgi:hypothetical protein